MKLNEVIIGNYAICNLIPYEICFLVGSTVFTVLPSDITIIPILNEILIKENYGVKFVKKSYDCTKTDNNNLDIIEQTLSDKYGDRYILVGNSSLAQAFPGRIVYVKPYLDQPNKGLLTSLKFYTF